MKYELILPHPHALLAVPLLMRSENGTFPASLPPHLAESHCPLGQRVWMKSCDTREASWSGCQGNRFLISGASWLLKRPGSSAYHRVPDKGQGDQVSGFTCQGWKEANWAGRWGGVGPKGWRLPRCTDCDGPMTWMKKIGCGLRVGMYITKEENGVAHGI